MSNLRCVGVVSVVVILMVIVVGVLDYGNFEDYILWVKLIGGFQYELFYMFIF